MKAIDLAKKLLEHPDFEVIFTDFNNGDVLDFDDVDVTDIGYSDKIIVLVGNLMMLNVNTKTITLFPYQRKMMMRKYNY